MSATPNCTGLVKLNDTLARLGRSTEAMAETFRRFARERWEAIWNDPVLLRATGKGFSKKVRRARGRRIKRLERGRK